MSSSSLSMWATHYIDESLLPANPVIVDAGAGIGDFIFAVVGEAEIYAIEPSRDNCKALRKTGVKVFPCVLMGNDCPAEVPFTQILGMHEWGTVHDLYREEARRHRKYRGEARYPVKVLRVRDLFTELGIDHIDYLKMDIEGSEGEVLRDMTPQQASVITQLSFEVHKNQSLQALLLRLAELGFVAQEFPGEIYACR